MWIYFEGLKYEYDIIVLVKIHLLADEVASQIAAGEVVERPASVVKELVENAIDARATRIDIRIQDAGQRLIEVTDDGTGISPDELALAVARHATSKLRNAEDLFHIQTLGFRGEALASIGSVSHLSILSQSAGHEIGARIAVDGGRIVEQSNLGTVRGTQIKVEDLFFNTPARLKFLKKPITEKQQITAFVTRYALAYPGISFRLVQDEQVEIQSPGNGDRREVLSQIYGIEMAKQLLEVEFEDQEISINGFISPISMTRSNRKEITFFVNGRWIQDIALTSALMKAYQTYLMVGRYPTTVLFISLPAEEVDVNVHPAKAEVRFREPDRIFALMQRAVKRALLAYSPVPQFSPNIWKSITRQENPAPDTGQRELVFTPEVSLDTPGISQAVSTLSQPVGVRPSGEIPILRLVGQVGATYLVAEGPDGLYLIDQHAAHERVLYEKMISRHETFSVQNLLQPVTLTLAPEASHTLEESLPVLQHFGFSVEEFGKNTFRISAVPSLFSGGDPSVLVRSVVEDFEEDETPLKGMIEERIIARICKRMAVKGGQVLDVEEQKALLRDLEGCISPRTCPHGRPTMIHLSVELLERQFGRKGARAL